MMCGKYENHVLLCAIRMGHTWHLKAIGLRITISDGIELVYMLKKMNIDIRNFNILKNLCIVGRYLYFQLLDKGT